MNLAMTAQPTVIKFFAPVIDATINALMQAVDQKLAAGQHSFTILVSSPGGSVFHGLSAYNYLKVWTPLESCFTAPVANDYVYLKPGSCCTV